MSWGTSEWGTSPWGGSEDAPSPPTSTRASWVGSTLDGEIANNWVGPHALDVEWDGYNPRPSESDADVTVTSTAELYAELGTSNQTIWLDEGTTFNVDNQGGAQNIATGVTLASDGALIQASDPKRPVFYLSDDDVRITGIRFEGEEPNPDLNNPPSGASITSRAIVIQAQGVEVDNCEVYGFTDSGIYVGWNENNPAQHIEPSVHHNIVRDNLYSGLGYGIVVYSGNPQLEYNYINGCRHGVAAGGRDACEYTLRNSIHGQDTLIFQSEMHEHPDTAGSSGIGATVENNEFRAVTRPNGNTARAYAQRGAPQGLTRFDNNWTWNPDGVDPNNPGASSTALSQTNHGSSDWVNVEWSGNHHGTSEPTDSTVGVQSLENLNAPAEQYTLNVTLTDTDGNTIEGSVDIHLIESISGPAYDHVVDASAGPSSIQTTLDSASGGDVVRVEGDGSYTWAETLEVPNGVTLDVSNDVSVTVPSDHNVTGYSLGTGTVYSLITCADRSSPSDVTIRGGTYDMSAMPELEGYVGAWLHNATNSTIEDVQTDGVGAAVYEGREDRGFGVAMTNCTECDIIDSEGHDSGYDDIGVRGGCTDCRVIRSGGTGGSSGTIQTARWGRWDLTGYPTGTEYIDCWGDNRIYDHDGIDTIWDGCTPDRRIQTIGTDNALIRNSEGFEGTVLFYTLDSGTDFGRVENMEFVSTGEDIAVQIGVNGGENIGTVEIDDCYADRPTWIHFNDYGSSATIGTVEVTNSELHGTELISKDSGTDVGTLIFRGCDIHDFSTGIVGSYTEVVVENCNVYGMSESDLVGSVSGTVTTSGNTYN